MRNLILFLLISIPIVHSLTVDVNVPEILDSRISSFILDDSKPNIVNIKTEVHNIGSLPFNSRVRLEVISKNQTDKILWSDEKLINPSEKKLFNLFFYFNQSGSFRIKVRIYYSNEIMEYKDATFQLEKSIEPSDIFKIRRMRISGNYLKFEIKSEENGNFVANFFDYPKSWIVEQKTFSLEEDKWTPVKVKFIPAGDFNRKIGFEVFSIDGNFYNSTHFELKKESKIEEIYNNFFGFLGIS